MNSLTIEQFKTIAKAIRQRESDVLGAQLSNTTVLNTLVSSLDLADNFSGFVNKQNDKTHTCMILVFDNKDEDTFPCEESVAKSIEKFAETLNCTAELMPAAHGFNVLYLGAKNIDLDTFAQKIGDPMRAFLTNLVEKDELFPLRGATTWEENGVQLIANFMYYDNEQVCSAGISEMAWRNRSSLNLDDTQALLVMYGDVEIEASYDSSDIVLQDVMYDVKFYDGP